MHYNVGEFDVKSGTIRLIHKNVSLEKLNYIYQGGCLHYFVGILPTDTYREESSVGSYFKDESHCVHPWILKRRLYRVFEVETGRMLNPVEVKELLSKPIAEYKPLYYWEKRAESWKKENGFEFRRTPVPGLGRWPSFLGHAAKHTSRKILLEPMIRPKLKNEIRRRLASYDYDHYSNERSWKAHRKHQWKEKNESKDCSEN